MGNFWEGLASVQKSGCVGFINEQGRIAIPMEYEPLLVGILFPFFEGFVLVKKARKCGFVNKVGEAIIQPAFNEAGNFSEGLALVNKQSRW